MTHTVRPGESLSTIARQHGVSVAQLLDANVRLKGDPNQLRIGDVLELPGQGTPAAPGPAPAPPSRVRVLGKLSEQFETSGRGPGTVSGGQGDPGGPSYGSYQMTSLPNGGRVKEFISQADFPFRRHFEGLTPGSAPFTNAWKDLANTRRDEFQAAQHEFIKRTHFDVLVRKILQDDRVNIAERSLTLQDVIWSCAVQHGPSSSIPHRAIGSVGVRPDDPAFDKQFIVAIYEERGRTGDNGVLVHFPRASAAVQEGVAKRFRDEQVKALAMLAQEVPA
jgi:LysM repeat protein